MHTAEAATHGKSLDLLTASARGAQSFEALYDVYGMDRMNLDGHLLLTSKLDVARIWTGEPAEAAASLPVHAAR